MTHNPTHPAGGAGAVKLKDCPIGLFTSEHGALCLKTEYGDNEGRIDAYIVDSGEFFWGGTDNATEQRQALVTPVVLRPPLPEPEAEGEAVARKRFKGLMLGQDPAAVWKAEAYRLGVALDASEAEIADLRARVAELEAALANRRMAFAPQYCQCESPVIRCDMNGCRCTSCGLGEDVLRRARSRSLAGEEKTGASDV